ncbi:winged helix-turn-helix domain-containing protein [Enterococcus sp. AZ072]|uniref:winged helix-turn-helix domain-containing protein n=1 Tax=unclassified Enterococcus TaxID=2608891 RepID=UPI003D27A59E
MQHALILTKNTLIEEETIHYLQRLNFEILCSTDLFYRFQKYENNAFLSYFRWIILSETLCHEEVESLLKQLKSYPLVILRIAEKYPSEEDQAYWKELGLTDWLVKGTSFSTLREQINQVQSRTQKEAAAMNPVLSFPAKSDIPANPNKELLIKSFSKTEKKVFEQLLGANEKGQVLSRHELCDYLWNEGGTPSNMSQLSSLINKMKRKFELAGIASGTITTLWGRGYQLSSEFYDYWTQCTESEGSLLSYTLSN